MNTHESTYYELLEVPPRASREEIQVAYNRSRAAFAQNSLAVYSLFSAEECQLMQQRIEEAYRTLMNEEARRRYDEAIGVASGKGPATLPRPVPLAAPAGRLPEPGAAAPRPAPPAAPRPVQPLRPAPVAAPAALPVAPAAAAVPEEIPEGAVVTGALLRKVRERRGISLREISQTSKVSVTYLQFIEEESFQQLPVPAYLRGFLKAYARCVGLDPERVSNEYIKLYVLYHEIKSER